MKRNTRLMTKTFEQLIEEYAYENEKQLSWESDDQMRKICSNNKAALRLEMGFRFQTVLKLLDDPQTTENPHGTYIRLIEG